MLCTNKYNLPPEVYSALTKNRYQSDEEGQNQKTDYSASTLISPVQQSILRRRYPDCNTEDAIDRVWTLFGHIAHALLEEHGSEGSITEKRFYMTVQGRTISGQVDHYKNKRNTDYKTTRAYKIVKQDFTDWTNQQNVYATLEEHAGLEVTQLRIIAIIRDWDEREVGKLNYPISPILEIPLLKWSKEARLKYINSRVALLVYNETLPDDQLTPCTEKERWMDFRDFYALKPGNKVGRCFKTKEEALAYQTANPTAVMSRRTTTPHRCMKYCPVSQICFQHAAYLKSIVKKDATNGQNIL